MLMNEILRFWCLQREINPLGVMRVAHRDYSDSSRNVPACYFWGRNCDLADGANERNKDITRSWT